jgi:hypothetical protein
MLTVGRLKLAYGLVSLLWVAYSFFELIAPHIADRLPYSLGTLYCMLLFVSVPALGYVLLFKVFPWTLHGLKSSRRS